MRADRREADDVAIRACAAGDAFADLDCTAHPCRDTPRHRLVGLRSFTFPSLVLGYVTRAVGTAAWPSPAGMTAVAAAPAATTRRRTGTGGGRYRPTDRSASWGILRAFFWPEELRRMRARR